MPIIKKTDIREEGKYLEGLKTEFKELLAIQKVFIKQNKELADSLNLVKKSSDGAEAKKLVTVTEKLKTSTSELTAVQKERLKVKKQLETAFAKSVASNEKQNKVLAKGKVRLQEQNKLLKQSAREALGLVGAYEKLSKRTNDAQKNFKNLAAQFGVASKQARSAKIQFDKLDNELRSVNRAAKDGRRDVGRYGLALKGVGRNLLGSLGVVGGMTALVGIAKNVVKVFKDFEKSTSKLASILNKTKDEIKDLTDQAKRLGATTAFTASEVISLQTELAKLGFSTKEIEASTEGILSLAAATGSDLASSAELAGATLRIFNLDASEMGRVTDVLAKSTTISSLSMAKLATILPTVGKTAQLAGVSLERTAALAGTLTDRGLDASSAATALRNIFLELTKKGISWNDAMKQINASTNKNKTALDLFGKRSAAAGVILAETAENTDTLTKSLESSAGAAQEMADVMLNNLAGDITKASSAWEGFILSLEDGNGIISKTFRGIVQAGTGFLNMLTVLNTEYVNTATKAEKLNEAGRDAIPLWDFQRSSMEALIPVLKKLRVENEKLAALRGQNISQLKKMEPNVKKFLLATELLTGVEAAETREIIKGLKFKREKEKLNKIENGLLRIATTKLAEYNKFQAISTESDKKATTSKAAFNRELKKQNEELAEAERRAKSQAENAQLETINTVSIAEGVTGGDDLFKRSEDATKAINEMRAEENAAYREKELEEILAHEEAKKELGDFFLEEAFNFANDLFAQNQDDKVARSEATAEAEKKILQDQLDKGLISEAEFAAKSVAIDKKAKLEAAKAEKRTALFSIAMNTANAIVKALGSSFPPFNFIAAGLVAAQGAIQAAFVAARPLPGFKDGVIGFRGKGTGTSDSNTVNISNRESIITEKGTLNAPLTLDAINKGLLTDRGVSDGLTKSQSSNLLANLLMKGNSQNADIITALSNLGFAYPFSKDVIAIRTGSGETEKHIIS